MTRFSAFDHQCMAEALHLAERGRTSTTPNPAVGCVIAAGAAVVGRGWHQRAGEAHAEVNALQDAGEAARGATAYVTLEPCCVHGRTPPCATALSQAGIRRVVYAMADPNPAVNGMGADALRAEGVQVDSGLMENAAAALNPGYAMRMREGRPRVTLKLGQSLDGASAMRSGESQWITGPAARDDVQTLRARACAVLTGIGTVVADDPSLRVRATRFGESPRQPLRVVLDSTLQLSPQANILGEPGSVLVVGAQPEIDARSLIDAGADYWRAPRVASESDYAGLDLQALLQELAVRGINEVLVEAGARLAGSLLQAGLVDRLVLYIAPKILGSETRGLFTTPNWLKLADGRALTITDLRQVGADIRITATL
ncbi:MAG: bifunctional diaminohydroxyphosphoribosylaminopyrimidine deaminase/5-amino-6-(5-phosphoribosylamino)uracil reductase RibD [Pseudomonadota bacterium]